MAQKLIEVSRTRCDAGKRLIVRNYDTHITYCRRGLWAGWESTFAEEVVLTYEHEPDIMWVGWKINGTVVVDPGRGGDGFGTPVPGAPGIRYTCPYDELYHKIQLRSTPTHAQFCLIVQALYRRRVVEESPSPGPIQTVCLAGAEVIWPTYKLAEEAACVTQTFEILRKVLPAKTLGSRDGVAAWLAGMSGEDAERVRGQIEALPNLNSKKEKQLVDAIVANLTRERLRAAQAAGG